MRISNNIYKYILSTGVILLLLVLTHGIGIAQNCSKKKLADKEMKQEYDYRGQSLFKEVSNGDTLTLNIVLYSKQNYRIFVVGEQKLGKVDYDIIVPKKKFSRVATGTQLKTIAVYKKDPNGFYLYNTLGERIPIGEETIVDTLWSRETTSIQEMVYSSKTADRPFWLATPNKTQLISIKVFVEKTEKIQNGCIGVYVGREYSNIYQFRR